MEAHRSTHRRTRREKGHAESMVTWKTREAREEHPHEGRNNYHVDAATKTWSRL